MPVLTFLHDLFSLTRGPYERTVGRHTSHFCGRAAKKAANEAQKRLLMVAAVCADELLAAFLGVDKKSRSAGKAAREVDRKKVRETMRSYLSALLVALGGGKELLLAKTGLNEQQFLQLWCQVFEYEPEDMQRFDQELVPAFGRQDADALAAAAAALISRQLLGRPEGIEASEVKTRLEDDVAAIFRVVESV